MVMEILIVYLHLKQKKKGDFLASLSAPYTCDFSITQFEDEAFEHKPCQN